MQDGSILGHIQSAVDEEHRLQQQSGADELGEARVRDPATVERYTG